MEFAVIYKISLEIILNIAYNILIQYNSLQWKMEHKMCKKSNENYIIDLPIDYSEYTEKQQRYLKNRLLDQIQWYDKKANIIKNTTKFYLSYLL